MENWTEISIDLAEKLFEPVDAFLKSLGSAGNVFQTLLRDEDRHPIRPCLKGYLRGSIYENKKNIDAINAYIASLQAIFSLEEIGNTKIKETTQEEWEEWKKFFKPTAVSKRVVIKPSWEQYTPTGGEFVIDIDPGMAFGTGTHETTRLSIRLLDNIIKGGEELLDVGTGSGILAIAAARLGVAEVTAIDNDEGVIKVAEKNVVNNGVEKIVEVSAKPLAELTSRFNIIVANILAETLIEMREEILRHVKKGGHVILSGILNLQRQRVIDAYRAVNIHLEDVLEEGEWSALLFKE